MVLVAYFDVEYEGRPDYKPYYVARSQRDIDLIFGRLKSAPQLSIKNVYQFDFPSEGMFNKSVQSTEEEIFGKLPFPPQ